MNKYNLSSKHKEKGGMGGWEGIREKCQGTCRKKRGTFVFFPCYFYLPDLPSSFPFLGLLLRLSVVYLKCVQLFPAPINVRSILGIITII